MLSCLLPKRETINNVNCKIRGQLESAQVIESIQNQIDCEMCLQWTRGQEQVVEEMGLAFMPIKGL